MSSSPIFVVGNRRSGTTMLRLMLASHPNIGVPPEGGFVVTMGWIWGRKRLSDSDYPALVDGFFCQQNAQDWELTPAQLLQAIEVRRPETFAQFVDEVYREYLRLKFPGKTRWGDKTTWYLDFLPMINRILPSAKFVHIIRDGRDIACSYRKMDHMPHDIRRIALEWTTNIETLRRSWRFLGPRRFIEIQYEGLVAEPRAALQGVCSFVGEEFSEEMLSFHKRNKADRLEPERHMGWKGKTMKPVDVGSVGRWRNELPERDVHDFESIASGTLSRLGYDLDSGGNQGVRRLVFSTIETAYGAYWRGRQALRGTKARMRKRFTSVP
jgi:hypothetical protein